MTQCDQGVCTYTHIGSFGPDESIAPQCVNGANARIGFDADGSYKTILKIPTDSRYTTSLCTIPVDKHERIVSPYITVSSPEDNYGITGHNFIVPSISVCFDACSNNNACTHISVYPHYSYTQLTETMSDTVCNYRGPFVIWVWVYPIPQPGCSDAVQTIQYWECALGSWSLESSESSNGWFDQTYVNQYNYVKKDAPPRPPPSPSPPPPPSSFLTIISGSCRTLQLTNGGSCVAMRDYDGDEECEFQIPVGPLTVKQPFNVGGPGYVSTYNGGYDWCNKDYLTINNYRFCEEEGLSGTVPPQGKIKWNSDSTIGNEHFPGWELCWPSPPSPPPSRPPPSPPPPPRPPPPRPPASPLGDGIQSCNLIGAWASFYGIAPWHEPSISAVFFEAQNSAVMSIQDCLSWCSVQSGTPCMFNNLYQRCYFGGGARIGFDAEANTATSYKIPTDTRYYNPELCSERTGSVKVIGTAILNDPSSFKQTLIPSVTSVCFDACSNKATCTRIRLQPQYGTSATMGNAPCNINSSGAIYPICTSAQLITTWRCEYGSWDLASVASPHNSHANIYHYRKIPLPPPPPRPPPSPPRPPPPTPPPPKPPPRPACGRWS